MKKVIAIVMLLGLIGCNKSVEQSKEAPAVEQTVDAPKTVDEVVPVEEGAVPAIVEEAAPVSETPEVEDVAVPTEEPAVKVEEVAPAQTEEVEETPQE